MQISKLKKRPLMVIHVASHLLFLPLFLLSHISLPMLIPPSANSSMVTGEAPAAFPSSLHPLPSLTQPLSFFILHGLSHSLSLYPPRPSTTAAIWCSSSGLHERQMIRKCRSPSKRNCRDHFRRQPKDPAFVFFFFLFFFLK